MTAKLFLSCAMLLLCSKEAQACYNMYNIQKGEIAQSFEDMFFSHSLALDYEEVENRYKKRPNLENYADYGVASCYQGLYAKAMKIFQEIERKTPNKYQTAANIGTTYELLGKLDSALFWIKRSLKINPDSHDGSEWIHVKILEHEIAAKGDANYSLTHSILGWDFGDEIVPKQTLKPGFLLAIAHQLKERATLVKPKNVVVGHLFFDLGNQSWAELSKVELGQTTASIERHYSYYYDYGHIFTCYNLAKKYGYFSFVMEKRIQWLILNKGQHLEIPAPEKPVLVLPKPHVPNFWHDNRPIFVCIFGAMLLAWFLYK